MLPAPAEVTQRRSADVAYAGAGLLFLIAPFERLQPLVAFPWQRVTTVEAAVAAACGAWFVALVIYGERPAWRSAITGPWVACVAVAFLAALAAPAFRVNALKVVGRLAIGLLVMLLARNGATTPTRLRRLIALAIASGVVVAVVATCEYAGLPAVLAWLGSFRQGVYLVGGQIRASGTLQYPTIASMYLEIVFALALGLFLAALDRRATVVAILLFIALALVAEGIVVTLTRAGLVSVAAALAVLCALRYRRAGWDRGLAGVGALAAVIVLLAMSSSSAETLRLRLTTEGQRNWYRAGFLAPATLSLTSGSLTSVHATVVNEGRMTWSPDAVPPFHVSYHWFDERMNRVLGYDGLRTPLPHAIVPGESLPIDVEVRAPRPAGRYTLGWDVVQEGRLWFSTEPGAQLARSVVTVSGEVRNSTGMQPVPTAVPPQATRLGRPALWMAALQMFLRHPLFGVGPDNFRLSYGPYVRVTNPDARVTSNNTYLEILADAGLAGLAAFAWLLIRAQRAIRETAHSVSGNATWLYAGVGAACLAMAVHGLVDSFLTLTPTYVLMSLTFGLAIAPSSWSKEVLCA